MNQTNKFFMFHELGIANWNDQVIQTLQNCYKYHIFLTAINHLCSASTFASTRQCKYMFVFLVKKKSKYFLHPLSSCTFQIWLLWTNSCYIIKSLVRKSFIETWGNISTCAKLDQLNFSEQHDELNKPKTV